MSTLPNFLGATNVSQSPIADQEETWNLYEERAQSPGATSQVQLYPIHGVTAFAATTKAPCRGALAIPDREFRVMGDGVYELTASGALTLLGTVTLDGNPATLCWNGDAGGQVFLTSGDNGYILNLTTNALTIERAGQTTMGDFQGGYFLALDADTSTFYLSDLLDGTVWDPTQFAQRSLRPDPWISMKVSYTEVWVLGTETSEAWVNQGTFPFPYAPHPSGSIEVGIAASFSVRLVDGTLMWVARTSNGQGAVIRLNGFTPVDVSTIALRVAFDSYARIDDGIGDTYTRDGHTFYVCTFPTVGVSPTYDLAGKWHKRGYWNPTRGLFEAYRPLYHTFSFGRHLMGDRETGDIYELTSAVATDVDGEGIRRMRRGPTIVSQNNRQFFGDFELLLEVGLGAVTGQGQDPQVMRRISNDGGKTWGNERWASGGELGRYGTLVKWTRNGSGRKRVDEIVCTDPIPWRFIDAYYKPIAASTEAA